MSRKENGKKMREARKWKFIDPSGKCLRFEAHTTSKEHETRRKIPQATTLQSVHYNNRAPFFCVYSIIIAIALNFQRELILLRALHVCVDARNVYDCRRRFGKGDL